MENKSLKVESEKYFMKKYLKTTLGNNGTNTQLNSQLKCLLVFQSERTLIADILLINIRHSLLKVTQKFAKV